ncbi:hypothetical protein GOACH_26_00420 [Gordonia aichiensis NBRC 108223]|uniref:Uncharacterized protein n=2 Tax=Gordonia aichiensis TaxID=36820 RepID=L7KP01_9ACTN|nr:hypothetical protein GOACH_26_00420 [Gordonia aichiensis NBRC 108223]
MPLAAAGLQDCVDAGQSNCMDDFVPTLLWALAKPVGGITLIIFLIAGLLFTAAAAVSVLRAGLDPADRKLALRRVLLIPFWGAYRWFNPTRQATDEV